MGFVTKVSRRNLSKPDALVDAGYVQVTGNGRRNGTGALLPRSCDRRINSAETYQVKPYLVIGLLAMSSVAALAQTAAPPANPKPATPAVTTSKTPPPAEPAAGKNSFTMAQAKSRIEAAGYSSVTGLAQDKDGVWRGKASKGGAATNVSVDYQGNVIPK